MRHIGWVDLGIKCGRSRPTLGVLALLLFGSVTAGSSAIAGPAVPLKTRPDTRAPAQSHAQPTANAAFSRAFASGSGAVVNDSNCGANVLPANDDGSTGQVALPFRLNFFGRSYSSLWVNNNGNVTFTAPLGTFTPFRFTATTPPIIAPFFADVDTRGIGSGLVTYGNTTYQGHAAFCVDWPNVGYFGGHVDKLADFQLLLVSRSDVTPGNFDIEFNYNRVQWETGDASGGSGGFGGTSAGVGFANGDGTNSHFFSLSGTLQNGAFLDSNSATGLIYNAHGTSVPGRYIYPIVNGTPVTTNRYVVLGDSIPYGHGLADPTRNAGPSRNAYPEYVDQGLPGLRRLSYRPTGCGLTGSSGVYYDQLAISGAPSIDNTWTGGNSNCGLPFHEAVFTDEVGAAGLRADPPSLVTIQAGANDVNFGGCLESVLGLPSQVGLLTGIDAEKCVTQDSGGYHVTAKVSSELGSLYSGLTDTIGFIHRNSPNAQIVLLNEYQVVPAANAALTGTSFICRDLRFSSQGGNWRSNIRGTADYLQTRLNGTIASVAAQFPDVAVVDIRSLMSGHEMCTLDSWLFDDSNNAAHPNGTGQQQIARAVLGVCNRRARRCVGR